MRSAKRSKRSNLKTEMGATEYKNLQHQQHQQHTMITSAQINRQKMDIAMTAQESRFRSLLRQIDTAFYDLAAPESEHLTWSHVGSAEYVNKELGDILQFLTR